MEKKYVIINADDFGMCHSHNVATKELFQCGGISSSTIMAPCSWCKEAVAFAVEHPEYAIGVHLTTTSEWKNYRWGPVSAENSDSLRDQEGYFFHESDEFEKHASDEQIAVECKAQIEKLKSLGLNPSHLDNHMGSLYGIETGRLSLLQQTVDLAGEYGLPFRLPACFTDEQFSNQMLGIKIDKQLVLGMFAQFAKYTKEKKVATPDYLMPGDWAGPQKESFENYREYIFELYRSFVPGAVTETYIHPAVESDELKAITSSWQHRVWEYQLFKAPETQKYFHSIGVELINYRQLKEMRGFA